MLMRHLLGSAALWWWPREPHHWLCSLVKARVDRGGCPGACDHRHLIVSALALPGGWGPSAISSCPGSPPSLQHVGGLRHILLFPREVARHLAWLLLAPYIPLPLLESTRGPVRPKHSLFLPFNHRLPPRSPQTMTEKGENIFVYFFSLPMGLLPCASKETMSPGPFNTHCTSPLPLKTAADASPAPPRPQVRMRFLVRRSNPNTIWAASWISEHVTASSLAVAIALRVLSLVDSGLGSCLDSVGRFLICPR